jgi:hypothetical protein
MQEKERILSGIQIPPSVDVLKVFRDSKAENQSHSWTDTITRFAEKCVVTCLIYRFVYGCYYFDYFLLVRL